MDLGVEEEQDIGIYLVEDFIKMEVPSKEVGIGEGDPRKDRLVPKIHSHDLLLGEIKELKFLLR